MPSTLLVKSTPRAFIVFINRKAAKKSFTKWRERWTMEKDIYFAVS